MNTDNLNSVNRRDFIQTGTLASVALAAPSILHAATIKAGDRIKIGLIGCGGRGSGAARNALAGDSGVVLWAMADVFPEKIESSLKNFTAAYASTPDRVNVPKERQFTGLDAYKEMLKSDVDVVLLAAPPGFRPLHFGAAVEAGKHIFCEKPMGTDVTGALSIMENARKAKQKGLAVVAGFCWRYDQARREMFDRVHQGDIGSVRSLYHTYLTGPVKPMPPLDSRPTSMNDVEWQLRNWMNFVWLSGDGFLEQACHSVDKMMWAMKDEAPVRCTAVGGRVNANPGGNIFDHVHACYEWASGVRGSVVHRQISGCYSENHDYVTGEKGIATTKGGVQVTGDKAWKHSGTYPNMYDQEHKELYASIRDGKLRNDGDWMCPSTLAGLMARAAAYSGGLITWDDLLKAKESLFPEKLDWNMTLPVAPMAVPGKTRFA
jgi:predicted dehydrogenase